MSLPETARFTASHEFVNPSGDSAVVGISPFAAEQLGDVVYVELPKVGTQLKKGQSFGVVESVKAVSDLYAPADGEVVGINEALNDDPGLVGDDATGKGWMLKLKLADPAQLDHTDLMTPAAYEAFIGAGGGAH